MISGIFENCIGSNDVETSLKYWAELGYKQVNGGQLAAAQAKLLYGYASNLTSLRLQNGNSSQHGLLRLMWWSEPRNQGLGSTLPMVVGSRWFASLTKDIYTIADAFTDDKSNGGDWIYTEPIRAIEVIGNQGKGLYNRFVGVREMFVIGSETRQAFFQRYNYNRPGYGTIDSSSLLGVSEGTHSSIVTANHSLSSFYTEVFGLVAIEENGKQSGYQNPSTRQTLMLEDGQEFYISAFSSPKVIAGVLQVYSPLYPTPDKREFAQPGSLGLSLFTYQVEDILEVRDRILASNATSVTPIVPNEFGEPSFGLVSPDGTYWVIVG
ncbi:hypothetical protein [Nostoc sp. 106C]|uniref:VOC family protein n=1 Tax=Nostoc sp. 106C TaxID=1932667 RepID=UPI000A36AC05|nr:hypothetical protein [Nostoc sp. 106C]OUL32922.1 hypothetical protein BV375_08520 [Nostoc sp. 106C]